MDMAAMLAEIRKHPDFHKAGMVLCHNGVVRQTSREGEAVTGLEVRVDHGKLDAIIEKSRNVPGIVDVRIWINEGRQLAVGDDVMFLAVAGDIRETVIQTLTDTLNRVKTEATSKTQFYKEA